MRKIYTEDWNAIEKYIVCGLNREDERLPKVLCASCSYTVNDYSKGIFVKRINVFDHSQIRGSSLITRDHTCLVCDIASASLNDSIKFKKSIKSNPGRPSTKPLVDPPSPITLCSFCLSKTSKGKPHICSDTSRVDNLKDIISSNKKTGEKLASFIIKDKVAHQQEIENIELSQSYGPTMKIKIVKKKCKKETLFTHDDILQIRNSQGMSLRGTKELAKNLRAASKNRKIISPGISNVIENEANHKLDKYFKVKVIDDFMNTEKQVPVVYCINIEDCLSIIAWERSISLIDSELKVGIDAGGGFLKVCLNLLTPLNPLEPSAKKRLKYENGIPNKVCQSTSVKKLIVLALAPNVPENYENVLRILKLLKFEELPDTSTVRYAADLKMINILLGLMSHSSNHPCSWCDIDR